MDLQNKRVAFLGDSITEGALASAPRYVYHSLLKDALGLKESLNYGICGTRIARQTNPSSVARFDQDFLMRYDGIDKTCDALVIFGGTNDYGHGDARIGSMDDDTEYTFYGALNRLYRKAVADFGAENVVVLTPMHRTNDTDLRGENNHKATDVAPLETYVNIIKEVAGKYGLPIVDLFNEDCLNPNISTNSRYFTDGLHPNTKGHALLAKVIAAGLAKL